MFEGYELPLIIISVVILAGSGFAFSKSLKRKSGRKRPSPASSYAATPLPGQQKKSAAQTVAADKNARLIAELDKHLRQICLHDEAKVQRLIEFERKRNPNANLAVLMQDAINRWIDDNR